MLGETKTAERQRELSNALSNLSNALYKIQHGKDDWDTKIKTMQQIGKIVPYVIRYMLWFKNTNKDASHEL